MKHAVVIGRNFASRLGMIRSIGKLGVSVYVINTNNSKYDVDRYSKYVKKVYTAIEPDEEGLIRVLLNIAKGQNEKMLLLPTDDYSLAVTDSHLNILSQYYLCQNINMTQGNIEVWMDKQKQKHLAETLGIPVAKGFIVEFSNGGYKLPEGITYPCFTKQIVTISNPKDFLQKCDNEKELKTVLDKAAVALNNSSILVEQFIDIEKEYAAVGFCDGKNCYMPSIYQMLLDGKGVHRGVTIQGKVSPTDRYSDTFDKFKKLMQEIHFTGLFDIDAYESGGILYFNELNLRLGASGWVMTSEGINLPGMFFDYCNNNSVHKNYTDYKYEKVFVNENGLSKHFLSKHITWSEYNNILRSSNIYFIKYDGDNLPYYIFYTKLRIKRIINWIKNIL